MVEEIHEVLCTLTCLCLGPESMMAPESLDYIGRLAQFVNLVLGALS
jgi:hypothetical protein